MTLSRGKQQRLQGNVYPIWRDRRQDDNRPDEVKRYLRGGINRENGWYAGRFASMLTIALGKWAEAEADLQLLTDREAAVEAARALMAAWDISGEPNQSLPAAAGPSKAELFAFVYAALRAIGQAPYRKGRSERWRITRGQLARIAGSKSETAGKWLDNHDYDALRKGMDEKRSGYVLPDANGVPDFENILIRVKEEKHKDTGS